MATLSTAGRNAACDAITALVDVSSPGTFLLTTTSGGTGTTLATITLNATAFGAASTGVCTLDVSGGLSATASATGTAAGWALRDGAATVVLSGSIGTSGTDLTIDNTSITSGQTVNLGAITVTVPAT